MPNIILLIIAFIGIAASIYAIYTERKLAIKKNYAPVCNINERISCSKSLTSQYAKTFGVKNSALGLLFYLLILAFAYSDLLNYIFYLSIPSIFFTIYLNYVSFVKLKNICPICSILSIVNVLILVFSYISI